MITKFNEFINESLLDKMKGKDKEDVWKSIGGIKFFNTPPETVKDFFNGLLYLSTETFNENKYYYEFNNEYIITVDLNIKKAYISPEIGKIILTFYKNDITRIFDYMTNNAFILKNFYQHIIYSKFKKHVDILDKSIHFTGVYDL